MTAVEPIAWSATSLYQPYDVEAQLDELRARAGTRLREALGELGPSPRSDGRVLNGTPVEGAGAVQPRRRPARVRIARLRPDRERPARRRLPPARPPRRLPRDRRPARHRARDRGARGSAHEGRTCLSAAATSSGVRPPRPHIVIAGGGVAAIEALLALRHLVGEQVAITLLAPEPRFVHRPSSVAEPFGLGGPASLDLEALARDQGAELARGTLQSVDPDATRPSCSAAAGELSYDVLVVAVGAVPSPAVPGAITFAGPGQACRGRSDPRPRRARRAAAARLRRPGRDDVVAAGLRARHDGRRRPARPRRRRTPRWASSRRSPSRSGCSAPPPAPRCGRCSTPAASALWTRSRPIAAARRPARRRAGPAAARRRGHQRARARAAPRSPGCPRTRAASSRSTPTAGSPAPRRLRRRRRDDVPGQAGRARHPAGRRRRRGDRRRPRRSAPGAAPFRPVLRGLLLTGGAPLYLRAELDRRPEPHGAHAARRGLGPRAVVAAGQGRRPLPRALPRHGPPGRPRLRAAARPRRRRRRGPGRRPRRGATSSRCCSPSRTRSSATTARRCTRSTRRPRSPAACCPTSGSRAASAGSASSALNA